MNIGGLIGGLIAGVLGAALWAAIAYYGEVEIGILAWGIGAAVGIGVSAGSRTGGVIPPLIAVLITVGSLVGGKYLAVQMAVRDFDQQAHSQFEIDDDTLLAGFAFEMAEKDIADGKRLQFRNGKKTFEATESFEDLPLSIVEKAQKKLDSLSPEEHDEMLAQRKADFEMMITAIEGELAQQGFIESFSGMDILFFLLGIFTAGKIALSDYIEQ